MDPYNYAELKKEREMNYKKFVYVKNLFEDDSK